MVRNGKVAAILDDRKSLSIAFLAISDQYATFLIETYLYSRSVAISNMKLIGAFLMKLWSAQAFGVHKRWRPFWFSDFLQNR